MTAIPELGFSIRMMTVLVALGAFELLEVAHYS
jgi:hypothetical protein